MSINPLYYGKEVIHGSTPLSSAPPALSGTPVPTGSVGLFNLPSGHIVHGAQTGAGGPITGYTGTTTLTPGIVYAPYIPLYQTAAERFNWIAAIRTENIPDFKKEIPGRLTCQ